MPDIPDPPPGQPAADGPRPWPATPREAAGLAGIFAVAAALAFAKLGGEVLEGETHSFDQATLLALRVPGSPQTPIGPGWLAEAARDLTALGSTAVITYVLGAGAGYLLLCGKRGAALVAIGAVGSGAALSSLLKLGFDRPRPEFVPPGMDVHTASFPSGHTMLSAVTYLTLGALLMRADGHRRMTAYILALAVMTTLLVGMSRIFLGVHWPTDVLGGWAAGAAWAASWWLLAWRLQRPG